MNRSGIRSSDYFSHGLDAAGFAGIRVPFEGLGVEAGLRLGATRLFPAVSAAAGSAYLISLGLESRLVVAGPFASSVHFRAGGGPTLLVVSPGDSEAKAKLLPFFAGGGGLGFSPLAGLRLGYAQAMVNLRTEYTNRILFLTDGMDNSSHGWSDIAPYFVASNARSM